MTCVEMANAEIFGPRHSQATASVVRMASLRTVVFSALLLVQLLIATGAVPTAVTQNTCAAYSSSSRVVKVNINSKRDQDGEWLTTFKAVKSDGNTDHFVVDVTQTVHDCAGGQAVQIMGVIHGNRKNGTAYDTLRFHPKCGTNAAISDDGKSVRKISDKDPMNAVILTHRPLRRNELFEVRLDRKLSSYSYSQGIGVTSFTPDNIKMPAHIWDIKSGNWMCYHDNFYTHGSKTIVPYGKSLDKLEVGDRIGVMVNNAGTLHFFVNGDDQGPAASNIPNMVYGVYELYYNAAAATIIDQSS